MLAALQRQLETIYEVEIAQRVEDFVVARPSRDLTPSARPREKLLVCQHGDELLLSLCLDADLVARLERDGPDGMLRAGRLDEVCQALEGVSHFLYLAWNAGHERRVTLLELEMQAEVDKYVALAQWLTNHGAARIPPELRRRLFDEVRFLDDLDPEALARYQNANYFAGKYSRQLERRHRRIALSPGMLRDLRRFYRLGQQAKMRRINFDF